MSCPFVSSRLTSRHRTFPYRKSLHLTVRFARLIKKGVSIKTLTKRLRLAQNEWEQIESKLKESELSFSSFALASMLGQKSLKRKQTPINRDFIAELSKWGNNLNQVAKHLNSNKGELDRVGLEMLSRIENHLKELRKVIE